VLRVLKILLYFASDDLEWMAKNRAARLKRPQAEGRIVIWTPDEINAAVACADWLTATSRDGTVWDFEGVGDAIIAGALSGQRLGDLIALAPIVEDDGVFQLLQSKTKRTAFVPITAPLRRRRAVMAARRSARWENVTFTHELVAGDGKPYTDAARFNEEFRAVRFCASGLAFAIEDCFRAMAGMPRLLRNVPFTPQPGLLGIGEAPSGVRKDEAAPAGVREAKDFRDLRDTAVTLLYEATGGDIARVATVTGHSLKTAQAIIDKHYFGRNADLARSAGRALDQLLAMKGIGA
jgi:integrase